MSDEIMHKGIYLGDIHSYTGDKVTKFNIVMEDIGALEYLLRLSNREIIEIKGMPQITYGEFKEQILSRTKRIYLSNIEYLIDFHLKNH